MSETTSIEWCDHTASPWKSLRGMSNRVIGFEKTVKAWNREVVVDHNPCGDCDPCLGGRPDQCAIMPLRRPTVFPSMCDPFDPEVPVEWLADFLRVVFETPNLTWLLLTKSPENWRKRLEAIMETECLPTDLNFTLWLGAWLGAGDLIQKNPPNVWIGASVENKDYLWRLDKLRDIHAVGRFVSFEPLLSELGEIDPVWIDWINWVIVGGESGPGARPCNVEWIRDILRQCKSASVPCFVKQDSGRFPGNQGRIPDDIWSVKEVPIYA